MLTRLQQVYFGPCVTFVAPSLFTPSIVSNLSYTGLNSQLMTVPAYAVGCEYCSSTGKYNRYEKGLLTLYS